MAKLCTLKLNKEYRTAYYHGKVFVHPLLIVYIRKNKAGLSRLGITTGKKVGKAVQRNRCRRIIREAYRQIHPSIQGNWDLVFVARTATADSTSTALYGVMKQLLKKAGLLT